MKADTKNFRTSDFVEWNTAMNLIHRLYRDGDFRMSLLFGCGCFFGLRISDILSLRWDTLLYQDKFVLRELKTNKRREVKINKGFQKHIQLCHDALNVADDGEVCKDNTLFTKYTHTIGLSFESHCMVGGHKKKAYCPASQNMRGRGGQLVLCPFGISYTIHAGR